MIEIAPAPLLPVEVRDKMFDHAVKLAHHVNYHNAGTVEFLVEGSGECFFIEVNARLQVTAAGGFCRYDAPVRQSVSQSLLICLFVTLPVCYW